MLQIPCLCVSTVIIGVTLLIAELLRNVINQNFSSGLAKIALSEALAAAELCGCCFELIIVADNYGVSVYALYLFALTIWWGRRWGDSSACPYIHFEECVSGSMSPLETTVRTAAEVIGGLAVYRYIYFLWSLEIAETHVGRAHSSTFDHCAADLQVSALNGALIEGVATLLCRCTSKYLSEKEPHYSSAIDSFVSTALVVAAFDYSGGYYNPVLATSLKFGCKGHTHLEHFWVYWFGASLGALASVYVYPMLFRRHAISKEKSN